MPVNIPGTDEQYADFVYDPPDGRPCLVRRVSGELRVPSLVYKSRDYEAQKMCSQGTGEHAGHLIGTQFGGAGGLMNLGLQNPNMNSYAPKRLQETFGGNGASYLKMEMEWAAMLEEGIRVTVLVRDHYERAGKVLPRPYYRAVEYSIRYPGKEWERMPDRIFGNFDSPQAREAKGR